MRCSNYATLSYSIYHTLRRAEENYGVYNLMYILFVSALGHTKALLSAQPLRAPFGPDGCMQAAKPHTGRSHAPQAQSGKSPNPPPCLPPTEHKLCLCRNNPPPCLLPAQHKLQACLSATCPTTALHCAQAPHLECLRASTAMPRQPFPPGLPVLPSLLLSLAPPLQRGHFLCWTRECCVVTKVRM